MSILLNRKQKLLLIMPVAAMLLPIPSAVAQIYKWRDNRGVMQYSDKPPVTNAAKATPAELVNSLQAKDLCAVPTKKCAVTATKASSKFSANLYQALYWYQLTW